MPRKQLIQSRRDSASDWTSANPVLASGENGFEIETNKLKIGDGTTPWNSLPYISDDKASKASLVVNIIDYAASTASTDNTTAIQAAIDGVSATGGGVVFVPKGTWTTGPLVMKKRVSIRGEGPNSVLKLKNGSNAHMFTLYDKDTDECGWVDISIDGNKVNQTGTGNIIHIDNAGYDTGQGYPSPGDPSHYIDRVRIWNGKYHGIYTQGNVMAADFRSVWVWGCDGCSYYFSGPDSSIVDCISANSGWEGFYIGSNSLRFTNCKSFTAGRINVARGNGWRVAICSVIDLIGCEAQDNRQHGFSIGYANQILFVGRANKNGQGADFSGGHGDGMQVEGLTQSSITLASGDLGFTRQRWAYNCGADNDGNIVNIAAGDNTDAGTVGVGSWGANSIVNITYENKATLTIPDVTYDASTWDGNFTPATKNAIRDKLEAMIGTNVVGPASATNLAVAQFDGTTGKLIKDSTKLLPSGTIVGTTDSQALSGKTLTAPKIVSGGYIADANGNEQLIFNTVASAVNEITLANAASGGKPTFFASGGDTNIDIGIFPKGKGRLSISANGAIYIPDQATYYGSMYFGNGGASAASLGGGEAQFNTSLGVNALNSVTYGDSNTSLGSRSGSAITIGSGNTTVGQAAGNAITSGGSNVVIGSYSGSGLTTGVQNMLIGGGTGNALAGGSYNTFIGLNAGRTNTTNGGVAIGWGAGYYETAANKLFIDNTSRANEADARAKSLIYGVFNAAVNSQSLAINGVFFPLQSTTASAPTYVKGGVYFDTTLNKLRIGGAAGWETVTST